MYLLLLSSVLSNKIEPTNKATSMSEALGGQGHPEVALFVGS